LVWTPIYERFAVTASVDCSEAFGYADFALGHFGRDDDVGQSMIRIIKRDWTMQPDKCGQERWETLIRTGLVKEAAIELMAGCGEVDDDVRHSDAGLVRLAAIIGAIEVPNGVGGT
jgi:hypothetical protein